MWQRVRTVYGSHPLARYQLPTEYHKRICSYYNALTSLVQVSKTDASYVPETDHWRSNLAACLWDDVLLHLHGGHRWMRTPDGQHFILYSLGVMPKASLKAAEKYFVVAKPVLAAMLLTGRSVSRSSLLAMSIRMFLM